MALLKEKEPAALTNRQQLRHPMRRNGGKFDYPEANAALTGQICQALRHRLRSRPAGQLVMGAT